MYTVHFSRNFILVDNFLNDDEKFALSKLHESSKIIQEAVTFDEYNVDDEKKELMISLFGKFVGIIENHTDPQLIKIYNTVTKLFKNTQKLNLIRMHFRPMFDDKAIDFHYDTWSNWNFICSVGGPSRTFLKDGSYLMTDGSAYLFNGAQEIHSVSLVRDDRFIELKPYRQCFQLRHYEHSAYITNSLEKLGHTESKKFIKHKKKFLERRTKLRKKADEFKKLIS